MLQAVNTFSSYFQTHSLCTIIDCRIVVLLGYVARSRSSKRES